MFDLLIKGGRVIDPASDTDGYLDIGVTNGLISAIGPNLEDESPGKVMQLKGELVIPGMIDLHVHIIQGAATPGVNEISGRRDRSGFPCSRALPIVRRYTSVLPLPVTPCSRNVLGCNSRLSRYLLMVSTAKFCS